MIDAVKSGIDDTLTDAVPAAKSRTPVLTGLLQGSIQSRPAVEQRQRVVGLWGSFDVNYAAVVESGTRRRPGRNMLRAAADQIYPSLRRNIRARFERAV